MLLLLGLSSLLQIPQQPLDGIKTQAAITDARSADMAVSSRMNGRNKSARLSCLSMRCSSFLLRSITWPGAECHNPEGV